ncbi:MAG: hypothetical protein AB2A00_04735 [Myxococcota bacterium]
MPPEEDVLLDALLPVADEAAALDEDDDVDPPLDVEPEDDAALATDEPLLEEDALDADALFPDEDDDVDTELTAALADDELVLPTDELSPPDDEDAVVSTTKPASCGALAATHHVPLQRSPGLHSASSVQVRRQMPSSVAHTFCAAQSASVSQR